MDIALYKNTSAPNVVNKSIKQIGQNITNVRFKEDGALDIKNPKLVLNYSTEVSDFAKFNYVRIFKFDRYYYIDDIYTEGGLVVIVCRCDVLMSFKEDILSGTQNPQYILRQQSKYDNPYLQDNLLPVESDHYYKAFPFGNPVGNITGGRVILETTGKGGTVV